MAVATVCFTFSSLSFPSFICLDKLTEPRLQTAISSAEVFSVISVQRLEEWITPACCWGDLRLHASLNVIQGCPVSNNIVSIFLHSSFAGIDLAWSISPEAAFASYSAYFSSNALPVRSCNSGVSPGENSVQFAPSSTLFMNKSGTQFAVFISCVLLLSSPVFFLRSRNSSMSRCHVSKYAHIAPFLFPPWFTATAVSLATFKKGTTPWLFPFVPLMYEFIALTGVQSLPRPPAHFDKRASSLIAPNIPSRSSGTVVR